MKSFLHAFTQFFVWIFGTKETKLVRSLFWATTERNKRRYDHGVGLCVDNLVNYFATEEFAMRRTGSRDYISLGGAVTICDDIYGPEVKLVTGEFFDSWRGSLDTSAKDYGLTGQEARRLYNAILEHR